MKDDNWAFHPYIQQQLPAKDRNGILPHFGRRLIAMSEVLPSIPEAEPAKPAGEKTNVWTERQRCTCRECIKSHALLHQQC